MTTYAERSAARKAAILKKRDQQVLEHEKLSLDLPDRVLAETVVEGRAVSEWAKRIDSLVEEAVDARCFRQDVAVIDLVEAGIPPLAMAAVNRWRKAGSPTEYGETAVIISRLHEQAEAQTALAAMEDTKANEEEAKMSAAQALSNAGACLSKREHQETNEKTVRHANLMDQHARYAATHREKASKFLTEAAAIREEWLRSHPRSKKE